MSNLYSRLLPIREAANVESLIAANIEALEKLSACDCNPADHGPQALAAVEYRRAQADALRDLRDLVIQGAMANVAALMTSARGSDNSPRV